MASPTQLVQMSFAGGIDESQRDEVLDPSAAFVALENARQDKRGGLNKRRGFTAQTLARLDATSRSAGYKLFAQGKQTCVIDGSTLDSYSTAAGCNVSRGRVPECALSMMKAPAPPGASGYTITDSCIVGNYLVVAYSAGQDHYLTVLDANTGVVLHAPEKVFAATIAESYPLLATYSTYVVAVFYDSGSSTLTGKYLNTTSAASITTGWTALPANIATDVKTGIPVTAGVESLLDRVAVVYVNNSGGASQVTVKTLNVSGVLETKTLGTGGVTPTAVAVEGSIADTLWVAWNQGSGVKLCGLDADSFSSTLATTGSILVVTTAPQYLGNIAIVSSSTAGKGRLFVNDGTGDQLQMCSFQTSGGAAAADGSTVVVRNVVFTGRPFRVGSRYYAPCRGYDTGENVVILCDLSEANAWVRPVANVAPRLSAVGLNTCRTSARSATEFWLPVRIQTAGNVYSTQVARFDFASTQRWQPVAHSGVTYLSGGLLSFFDGQRVAEAGFVIRPPAPTISMSGAGTFSGSFKAVAVYEHVDAAGNWHVSGVSDPVDSGSFTNKTTATITVRGLGISNRISQTTDPAVRISIYATPNGGSAPYYYVTSLSNTLSAATQTTTMADFVSASNAKLYAPSLPGVDGSAQDRRAPPGLTHITAYNGMLVGAQGEDVFYSGQDVAGEGTWFNPVFQVPVSGDGDITGLAAQDGTLYVFKRRAIFAIAGEPPSDNGAAGGLGTPRRLAVDVGCIDARSIVVTSMGVFFQSERGIELLTRAQSVTWIGAPIQDTLASYPVVSAATLDPTESAVYLELAASEASGLVNGSGRTLVYDLSLQQWQSIDRRASYAGTADAPAQSAAMVWDGNAYRYAWLETGGYVRPEQDSHLDSGSADTWVTMKATSGWIKLSGVQGQQVMNRVLLLAKKQARSNISIALAYDYDATFETASTWTADGIDTLSSALARVQLGHDAHDDGEGQAIRAQVSDATPTGGTPGTGEGATWIALTFEGTPRPNAAQLPDTAR